VLCLNSYQAYFLQNVGPLPGYVEDAVKSTYGRYMKYLESFGPDEHYLRKKVETELGTKMIHLKMRCSGIGSEWGKVCLSVYLECYLPHQYDILQILLVQLEFTMSMVMLMLY
jgi:hypothetical protein